MLYPKHTAQAHESPVNKTPIAKILLSLLLLLGYSSATVSAQPKNEEKQVDPYIREHNERLAKNPEGLLFTVRIKDNRKQFHLGEVIPLELSFSSSKPETFRLDAATYDRSGRLNIDSFILSPRDGVVDPLVDYFKSGLHPFLIGGLRSFPDLTDKPYVITAELNEWQRIDTPGHYRLHVLSSRVGRKVEGSNFLDNARPLVVSNVIEFDVLPSNKKWATQRLSEALSALSKKGAHRNSACRTLRFLGTTAAVTEMVKRFIGDHNKCEWEYKFGLIGSPHRDFVIREMANAISLREQPVTSHFISTLALLEFSRRAGPAPRPAGDSDEQFNQWQDEMFRRRAFYDELHLHYLPQLVMAIPQKQGYARATSLHTVLDFRSKLNPSDFSRWSTLLALIPEVFNRLPSSDRTRMLQYEWKLIASEAMLPVLREILNNADNTSKSNSPEDDANEFRQRDLRSIALRRLYELSAEEGRRLILEEIRNPKLGLNQEVLCSLPDETLPELNRMLLSRLEGNRRYDYWYVGQNSELIERYATDEILPRVQAFYESRDAGKWECRTQAALLAYFLRVAPSLGGEHLSKALAARGSGYTRCFETTLKEVAKLHMSAEVEEVATAALDDDDSEVVSQAAAVLAEHGSAEAEKALWRRLEKWSQSAQHGSEELSREQKKIEQALRQALTRGHAWLLDPEKLKSVRDLCLTDESRKEIDRMIDGWVHQIYIALHSLGDKPTRIGVAHYELHSLDSLKAKILQFPKGTIFKLKIDATRGNKSRGDEIFQEIKGFLEEHGMSAKDEPSNN